MNFVGSLLDMLVGAAIMWTIQTLGWPFIKGWIKTKLKAFVNS